MENEITLENTKNEITLKNSENEITEIQNEGIIEGISDITPEDQILRMVELGKMYLSVKDDPVFLDILPEKNRKAFDTLVSVFVDNNTFLKEALERERQENSD